MMSANILDEITTKIKKRTCLGRIDFWSDRLLVTIAVLSAGLPIVLGDKSGELLGGYSNYIASLPAGILLFRNSFKLREKADWHWDYRRQLTAIVRMINYEEMTDKDASIKLNKLDKLMATYYPADEIVKTSDKTKKGLPDDSI